MATLEQVEEFVGKYVNIEWTDVYGSPGGMNGWLWQTTMDAGGLWAVTDEGMAIQVAAIEKIEECEQDPQHACYPMWERHLCCACAGTGHQYGGPCRLCSGSGSHACEPPSKHSEKRNLDG